MDEQKRVLVFLDDSTGLECALHLLSDFPHDAYTFIVGPHDQDNVYDRLRKFGRDCRRASAMETDYIRSMRAGRYDWLVNAWADNALAKEDFAVADRSFNVARLDVFKSQWPEIRG